MQADAAEVLPVTQQIALIEERLAATNARDWDRWEALHTPDAIRTAPELEQPLRSAAAMRAAIEALSAAFPDYHLELEQAFGQGEWLAVRLHTAGTMTGPLMLSDGSEVPATGQSIDQDWSALVRFDGDRVAEFHEFYDQLTLMVQLGLIAP
jgi:ketosteroid isomerase-like protein